MFENYPLYEKLFAQLQLILFMVGTGATLTAADFAATWQRPRFLVVGALLQFLLTPLVAVLVNTWFGLPPGVAVGLILVAAMPGGTLSKGFAYVGRGNLALSVSLTLGGTLASIVTVPLLLRTLAYGYVPDDFAMPVDLIVLDVAVYLLLPLGVGMLVARFLPAHRRTLSRWCIRVGLLVVVAMITGALGSERIRPGEYGWRVPVAIIVFCMLSQQLSMLPFRLLGWPRPDCLAVGMEVTMRNLNLALLLKAILFPATERGADPVADGVLFVILYYAAVALVAGFCLAMNFLRMARRDERRRLAAEPAEVQVG